MEDCDVCGDIDYADCDDCKVRLCKQHDFKENHHLKCNFKSIYDRYPYVEDVINN